jgi:anti-sigma factor RsiW
MNCGTFQDSVSDYLDGALDPRARAEFGAHRLGCRACRDLFGDVRATLGALGALGREEVAEPVELKARILAATTAGEMLSCGDFDSLIERYFDGVILAPTFQTFQAHFAKCSKCRRLLAGIEEAIDLCREAKAEEVEVPDSLYERIVAATVGAEEQPHSRFSRWGPALSGLYRAVWTPQLAAAALIFAASGAVILSRFGSVGAMASEASERAERLVNEGQAAINQTGSMAITGIQRVSSGVNSILQDAKPGRPGGAEAADPQPSSQPGNQPTRPQGPKIPDGDNRSCSWIDRNQA